MISRDQSGDPVELIVIIAAGDAVDVPPTMLRSLSARPGPEHGRVTVANKTIGVHHSGGRPGLRVAAAFSACR